MLKLVTAPVAEPVNLSEVKSFCVVGHSDDDDIISLMISSEREYGESQTAMSWTWKTLELILSKFPAGKIALQAPPVNEVLSIKYIDADGVEQTIPESDYVLDKDSFPGFVEPVTEWPDTAERTNAVRIRYTAGSWDGLLPSSARLFIMHRVATRYAQRESFVVGQHIKELPRDFLIGLLDEMRLFGGVC